MSVKHPSAGHPQKTAYRCNGVNRDRSGCPAVSISAGPLDAAVWDRVTDVLLKPEIIAAEVERRRDSSNAQHDIDVLDRRLAAIDRQRQNLVRTLALVDDEDSRMLMTRELIELSSQYRQLETERAGKVAHAAGEIAENQRLLDLALWCTRAASNLDALSYNERRMVFEALGVSVRVWTCDHDPRWELTLAPMPVPTEGSVVFSTVSGSSGTTA